MLSAPWRRSPRRRSCSASSGLGGLLYAAIVIRRARRQTGYKPVFEDWLWHAILPVVAYGAIVGGAVAMLARHADALFAIAAATLLLVFIGIHNAWDTVTWHHARAKAEEAGRAERGCAGAVGRRRDRPQSASRRRWRRRDAGRASPARLRHRRHRLHRPRADRRAAHARPHRARARAQRWLGASSPGVEFIVGNVLMCSWVARGLLA